jgi:hypothetical protein
MSKKIGMNVALGLNTGGFSQGLNRAKLDMDKFSKDIKRQNELAGKFGAAGLGRGFGIAGGVLEGLSMGGAAAGLTGVVAAVAGMAMMMRAAMNAIEGMNKAVLDAKKSMAAFAEGKAAPGTLSGFTPLAAKPIVAQTSTNLAAEAIASNLVRSGTIEEAVTNYVISSAPQVAGAVAGEITAMGMDLILGRESLNRGRLRGAAFAAVAGDFGMQNQAAEYLAAARRGEITQKERAAAEKKQQEALRGN